jgi:DNA helicase-2/ATP-dependent DNA helicase PcrA
MTVHAAKGLEFPVVWVAGLEERLFPLSRGNGLSQEDLEEERRLAYVAFTRAEQRLFLSYARIRRLHGDTLVGLPSPFLDELPAEHVTRLSRVDARAREQSAPDRFAGAASGPRYEYDESYRPARQVSYPDARSRAPSSRPGGARTAAFLGVSPAAPRQARAPGESYVDRSDADHAESGALAEGMHVRHAKFGEGQVLKLELGRPIRATVRFPGWGVKQIAASYLQPV